MNSSTHPFLIRLDTVLSGTSGSAQKNTVSMKARVKNSLQLTVCQEITSSVNVTKASQLAANYRNDIEQ